MSAFTDALQKTDHTGKLRSKTVIAKENFNVLFS